MARYVNLETEYWQDKGTGQIIECPAGLERDELWRKHYRHVRLLHHPESGCLMVEDVGTCLSYLDDPLTVEIGLEEYNYWKLIYENPDI